MEVRNIINNLLFWILMILAVGVAIWKLVGSPTDTATIITITLFFASSELLIWKAFFGLDKKNILGFMKISKDISHIKRDVSDTNNKINSLDNKLNILMNKRGK